MLIRGKQLVAALALAAGLAACSDTPSTPTLAPAESPAVARAGRAGEPIRDRYIVVFRNEVRDVPGLVRQLAGGATVHHTYQHAIKGFAATLPEAAAAALRNNPNVAYVEQDRLVYPTVASWGLDRIDQRALPLNNTFTPPGNGAGVRVYVIDTGIETSHPEFGGRASVGYDALGGNGLDCNGHGTHVAGTIGGANYGVATGVSLVSVRIFPCSGGTPWSTTIAAIDWVRLNRVLPAVANMSFGGAATQAVDDAVSNLIASGVTVAVAAGNDWGYDACNVSPARVGGALTVGASNASDVRSAFSNIGSCVDLFAPGEQITSAWLSGGANTIDGTSMATPHVAGVAALHLQASPSASPATVSSAIVSNASINRIAGIGTGSPNRLLYALSGTDTSPPPAPSTLYAHISGPNGLYVMSGTFTWNAHATGGTGSYSYQWQHRLEYGSWTNVGTNSASYTRFVGKANGSFYLRVKVTSGGYTFTSPEFFVYKESMYGIE
jgi:subtilisin family serine protease